MVNKKVETLANISSDDEDAMAKMCVAIVTYVTRIRL